MNDKVYIVIIQTDNLKIGDVFEQTADGFFQLEKEPYRATKTGTMMWRYKRKETSIAWPYEIVAPFVIEQEKSNARH